MIVLGITGSIGMGKTTVANMLSGMGIPIHDADAAVHHLLAAKGKAVEPVAKKFPEALKIDTAGRPYIDRHILGRIVFSDREKKRMLEDILHPMVRAESDAFKEKMKEEGYEIVALDIPLLFETGGEKRVDITICVSATPEHQRERVLARPGMTSEKFDKIVAGQLPDSEKRKRADYVICTDEGIEDTKRQIREVVEQVRAKKAS
jgi:dephospho-CoA kinase